MLAESENNLYAAPKVVKNGKNTLFSRLEIYVLHLL